MVDSTRRNALKTIGSAGFLLTLGGVGTATARQGASAEQTIVDIAQSDDRFDDLVAAVVKADLVETLSGNRQLTVFAPTDDVFPDPSGIPKETLVDILTYHVTPGRRYAASVVNAPRLPTLNGAFIDVDGTVLEPEQDDEANITQTDIEASNGVIHVIDNVLMP